MNTFAVAACLLATSLASGAVAAGVETCSQMLVEVPGSIEARGCFTREIGALSSRMKETVAAIEVEVAKGRSSFQVADFKASQSEWEQYVRSTCWLDAAGAGNAEAVFDHCRSRYMLQRLSQLRSLRKGLSGEAPVMWPMSQLDLER